MDSIEIATALIKKYEGCRLAPYLCPAGKPTIGWGTTVYPDTGIPVTMKDDACTQEQADAWLDRVVQRAARAIDRLVEVPLTDPQKAALIDFVYNLGEARLSVSTLLRKLNAGDYAGAAAQFDEWDHIGTVVNNGLLRRRQEETDLFTKC